MEKENKNLTENNEKYNGWTNRETWLINLHLTNTQNIYNEVLELLKIDYEYEFQKEDKLKDFVENFILIDDNDEVNLLRSDLINTALSRVNWKEIVKSFMEND